jgi:hypothetical protein
MVSGDHAGSKSKLGQFMTPPGIAAFMASLFDYASDSATFLLDAGAGQGALTDAFIRAWIEKADLRMPLFLTAYEVDPGMQDHLRPLLERLVTDMHRQGGKVEATLQTGDFIQAVASPFEFGNPGTYTHAILNPPYKKITSDSPHRKWLRDLGVETVNLYSGFVAVALQLLKPGGQLVAIVPRSFCNGPYYRPFREMLLRNSAVERIHLFESRTAAFKAEGVLQENLIIKLVRGNRQGPVAISTSRDDSFDDGATRSVPFATVVHPGDTEKFIRIPQVAETTAFALPRPHDLAELGLQVSTGPVVDYRLKEYLLDQAADNAVPLVYPCHFAGGKMRWPMGSTKKKCAILDVPETRRWLYPAGCYVVTRRLSSKEESRRIVANVVTRDAMPEYGRVGFENHLNVFHTAKNGLDEDIARGLCAYLNSSQIDRYFRAFNGHTQVNATDLRKLPYPSVRQLKQLGRKMAKVGRYSQEQVDTRVEKLNAR